jgi:ammonium transporter Rh
MQVAMIILFGTTTRFDPAYWGTNVPGDSAGLNGFVYASWQDTHTMMVIGFGFLYTLLRRYSWSGVALNLVITAFTIQWALLCNGFWTSVVYYRDRRLPGEGFPAITLNLDAMIAADYTAATVLISFGALLGRVSAAQMLLMLFVEVILATANAAIATELGVNDAGGSMVIHIFGAAFGLAAAAVYGDRALKGEGNGEAQLGTSRTNGVFASECVCARRGGRE